MKEKKAGKAVPELNERDDYFKNSMFFAFEEIKTSNVHNFYWIALFWVASETD